MTATFGKLKNARMELGDGLNIICAPNEYGKSTWCAFIKAMLYGIDTSSRASAGFIPDKTRYAPWDGGAMAGMMDLVHEGQAITIERKALGAAPMKNFHAVRTGTVDLIRELTGDNAGETLTGVTERVFERTAFVRRPGLRVDQTPELEKRIAMLVASGDEDVSYTETDELLRRQLRGLEYKNRGAIPALEGELAEAKERLEAIGKMSDNIAGLRDLTARLQRQAATLEEDLKTHDKLEARAEARRVAEARGKMKTAEAEAEAIRRDLTRNGRVVTREDLNEARTAIAAIEPLREVRENTIKAAWSAEQALADVRSRVKLSPLGGLSPEAAEELAAKAETLEKAKPVKKTPFAPLWVAIALIALGLALAAVGIIGPLWSRVAAALGGVPAAWGTACFVAGLVLAAAGAALFFVRRSSPSDEALALHTLLAQYKVGSAGALAELARQYGALCGEAETAAAASAGAEESRRRAEQAAADTEARARAKVADLMPGVTSGEAMAAELGRLETLLNHLTGAEFDALAAKNVYETLLESFDGDPDAPEAYIPMPLRNRADTETALAKTRAQLQEAESGYHQALGQQRAMGDPAVIEGEIADREERLREEKQKYRALELAVSTLAEANTELQTRFSPLLSQRAGEIMRELTGERYEKLLFDKSFAAAAKTVDDAVPRAAITLSDGTEDEVYFALRLAMCELMLSEGEPCPIILDDALANFDDERCRAALRFLEREAARRQIILFTCHSREGEMADPAASKIIRA